MWFVDLGMDKSHRTVKAVSVPLLSHNSECSITGATPQSGDTLLGSVDSTWGEIKP